MTKILVVEDESASYNSRTWCGPSKTTKRQEPEPAGEAVEEIFRSEPSAILLDPELPGIGGLTVVGYFKRNAKTRPIGIIVISASAERYRRGQAMAVATARS